MSDWKVTKEDVEEFERSGPRYTSYPTAAVWNDQINSTHVEEALSRIRKQDALSLYLHLPFCEKLCHFCACNKIIDKNHTQDRIYLDALKKEIELTRKFMQSTPGIIQIHWGGGTPTFYSPNMLKELYECLVKYFPPERDAEISLEVNPVVTTADHVRTLRALGFNRLSMGVQDFDPNVQDAINRFQTFEETAELVRIGREEGYASINVDLVYGLPRQTKKNFEKTMAEIVRLKPDRLAIYSYANVPWKNPFQRRFKDEELPKGMEKIELYMMARDILTAEGYEAIGIDHFALPGDELLTARENKTLHRNFMGYTTHPEAFMLGMGVSAISSFPNLYAQNTKTLESYFKSVAASQIPAVRGIELNQDDEFRRYVINQLMCNFEVTFEKVRNDFGIEWDSYFGPEILQGLRELEKKQLLRIDEQGIFIIGRGQVLTRNIAMLFDKYLPETSGKPTYSSTI